jgi:hypothetical protein
MVARLCGSSGESLAEYLLALGSGDRCPCCGAAFETVVSTLGASVLVCRECGCEVEAEEPFLALRGEGFSLAA